MEHLIKLRTIPREHYPDYRYEVIFKAYKWDPQVEDHNTVSRHVLVLARKTSEQLKAWAEQLSAETMALEEALVGRPDLAKEMGLPGKIRRAQPQLSAYSRNRHVRLMRYDFHPTSEGWAVSEVNSDVPGGFAEGSVLPEIAGRFFPDCAPEGHFARSLLQAFQARVKPGGTIAFVHATAYSDDRQIIQFISDYFTAHGFRAILAAPDHIRWGNRRALYVAGGGQEEVDGIVRYFPVEWLINLPKSANWAEGYASETPCCNHPVVILTQSKRLPLVWDRVGVEIPTWKALLPQTRDPREIRRQPEGWIYKPALGRVGQGISIREAVSPKEYQRIARWAKRYPRDWVAQRQFSSQPYAAGEDGNYHLCVGVFTVDGKFAGFYGRMSPYARIDAKARDLPILVEKEGGI